MNPVIKTSNYVKVEFKKNSTNMPDLNYDLLNSSTKLKDMRKSAISNYSNDIEDISKNSKIPIPGLLIEHDENSDGSYIPPHSDWAGPTGHAWIGK